MLAVVLNRQLGVCRAGEDGDRQAAGGGGRRVHAQPGGHVQRQGRVCLVRAPGGFYLCMRAAPAYMHQGRHFRPVSVFWNEGGGGEEGRRRGRAHTVSVAPLFRPAGTRNSLQRRKTAKKRACPRPGSSPCATTGGLSSCGTTCRQCPRRSRARATPLPPSTRTWRAVPQTRTKSFPTGTRS